MERPLAVAFTFLSLLLVPARAEPPTTRPIPEDPRTKPIVVVADDNYPPYIFRDEKGELQGIVKDRWDLFSKKTGLPVQLEGMNWSMALNAMAAGRADVIDTIFLTEERALFYEFSPGYADIDVSIFFHKSIGGITDAKSLRGFSVAVKTGDSCAEWLKDNGINNLKPLPNYEYIVNAVKNNDEKIFCMDLPPALYYLYKSGLSEDYHYTSPIYSGEFHWAVAKTNPALYASIAKGFNQITPDELKSINEKWMGYASGSVPRAYWRIALYVAGGGIFFVVLLAVWNRSLQRRVSVRTNEAFEAIAALKRSERHFEQLVATTPSGVFELGINQEIIYANDRWFEIHGVTSRHIGTVPLYMTALLHPEDRDWVLSEWANAIETGRLFRSEHRIVRRDGKTIWVLSQLAPRKNADNVVIGHIGSVIDISERKAAELALQESEQRFRVLYREAPLPYQSLRAEDGIIVDVNEAWLELFGYSRSEVIGRWIGNFAKDSSAIKEVFGEETIASGLGGKTVEIEAKDGASRLVAVNGRLSFDTKGAPERIHCILTDITERTRLEDSLRLLTMAVQQSPLSVIITDVNGTIEYVNPAFTTNSGYSEAEIMGKRPNILKSGDTSPEEYRAMWRRISEGETWHGTFHNRRKDGTYYWEDTVVAPVRDASGAITHYIGMKQDITARREAEARVAFLAHHDALTRLPNRLLGKDRMEWAMAHADRSRCKAALAFLDLDNFKRVNDSLGHSVGDALLRAVAERLRECVRETDTISRQGGDEFLIVLSDIDDPEAIARVATKILQHMAPSFLVGGLELSTTLSIGIAVYPDDGFDFDSLLKRADTAMYHAKEAGRNTYRFFTEQMNIDANEYLTIRNNLQRAIEHGEFVLHYQPQISLSTGLVTGVEALIRWNHPEIGMVGPGRFISIAEDSGLIVPIGDWVLRKACHQAKIWQQANLSKIVVAVNLSGVQFKRGDLLHSVTSALEETGLDPCYLELEVTESTLVKDTDNVLSTIEQFKALGVQLSIDDFGTGYSSLAYLKKFQVDKVKIDQSFVRDITSDANDEAIVHAIVQMAHSLGLKTIAEGVEDSATLAAVKRHECDAVQGFHFARPMPADKIPEFLASRASHPEMVLPAEH